MYNQTETIFTPSITFTVESFTGGIKLEDRGLTSLQASKHNS